MKIEDLRELLKNKDVNEEINKHLWIESQKAGYSIGIERATDEWLQLHATAWMKYNMSHKYEKMMKKKEKAKTKTPKVVKKKVSAVKKKAAKTTKSAPKKKAASKTKKTGKK